jgi:hypothetical protein
MIRKGLLEIKIVSPRDCTNKFFHAKFGIIEKIDGSFISFSGSANETAAGINGANYEDVIVYEEPGDHQTIEYSNEFNKLWSDKHPDWRADIYQVQDPLGGTKPPEDGDGGGNFGKMVLLDDIQIEHWRLENRLSRGAMRSVLEKLRHNYHIKTESK